MAKQIKRFIIINIVFLLLISENPSVVSLKASAVEPILDEMVEKKDADENKVDKLTEELEDLPIEISADDIYVDDTSLEYNGEVQWPFVMYGDFLLEKDFDYSITCIGTEEPVEAGIYYVDITMKGNYSCENTIHKSFKIDKADLFVDELVAPNIEISEDYIKLDNTVDTYEYQIVGVDVNNADASLPYDDEWQTVNTSGDSIVKENLLPGKPYYIYFRIKETKNYKASNMMRFLVSTSLIVKLIGDSTDDYEYRTVGHELTAQVTGDAIAGVVPVSYKYYWYRDGGLIDNVNGSVYKLTKNDIGHIIMVDVVRDGTFETEGYSEDILVVAEQITPEQLSSVIDIDYKNETIGFKEDGYYELSLDGKAENGVSKLKDLSSVINNDLFDIYARNLTDEREFWHIYSWVKMSIQGRPEAPTVTIKNASGKDKIDGSIIGKTSGLEYRKKTDVKYTELTDDIKVAPGTYMVRVAATDNSFAGFDREVVIGYTGTSTAKAIKKPTSKGRIVYNGYSQELVNRGTTSEGTILYSTEKDGSYSTSVPTAQKPGSYSVWWKIRADSTHTDSQPVSIVTTITKRQLTIGTPIKFEKIYDGTTAAPINWNAVDLNGVIYNDDVGITGTAVFDNPNVGSNKILRVTNLKLTGSSKDNYTLAMTSTTGVGIIRTKEGKIESETVADRSVKGTYTASRSISSRNQLDEMDYERIPYEDPSYEQREFNMSLDDGERKPDITASGIILDNSNEGKILSKYLSLSDISIEDKYLIDAALRDASIWLPNIEILDYMDISVFEPNEDVGWLNVAETAQPVKLLIRLDENQIYKDHSYYVLRIHDGKTKLLSDEDEDDGTVTISTNLFSTYVLLSQGPSVPLAGPVEKSRKQIDMSLVVYGVIGMNILVTLLLSKRKSIINSLRKRK